MTGPRAQLDDPDAIARQVVERVGRDIVLALPLGLGKANHVANALFMLAVDDPSIRLRVITALTLEKPRPSSELEARFINPVIERLFGGYPELAYAKALREGALPDNVEVNEFFLSAGRWLTNPAMQQGYISANYTHALGYILDRGVNVVAQLVARDGDRFSVSCNADITPDLLAARREGRADFVFIGEVNDELPYMAGAAEVDGGDVDYALDAPALRFPLFAPPRQEIDLAAHAAGLHIARLVPDGGTLQIGIGSIADALAHGLILRHRDTAAFRAVLDRLIPEPASAHRHDGPFDIGLHAVSEMLVDSFLDLVDAGVVAREVDGVLVEAAFFLGPRDFYSRLRDMNAGQRARLSMRPVSWINELYGDEAAKRRARTKARFVNNAMMATTMGAVVSDGLEDGRVISGVGGQHNFVAQAFALEDARSVITLQATRRSGGKTTSNIVGSYGHVTIPRHLRDIVVTEYGIADLRGRSDGEVIAAMLSVADSRFQPELLRHAKDAGKIAPGYEIPQAYRDNTPDALARRLAPAREAGLLPAYPFGTDFTAVEQRLMPALKRMKSASRAGLAALALRGLMRRDGDREALERMGLATPESLRDRAYAAVLSGALAEK